MPLRAKKRNDRVFNPDMAEAVEVKKKKKTGKAKPFRFMKLLPGYGAGRDPLRRPVIDIGKTGLDRPEEIAELAGIAVAYYHTGKLKPDELKAYLARLYLVGRNALKTKSGHKRVEEIIASATLSAGFHPDDIAIDRSNTRVKRLERARKKLEKPPAIYSGGLKYFSRRAGDEPVRVKKRKTKTEVRAELYANVMKLMAAGKIDDEAGEYILQALQALQPKSGKRKKK